MAGENIGSATCMTMAAVIIGLSITEEMSVADQNVVANLLFAAAQAISTRASLIPEASASAQSCKQNEQKAENFSPGILTDDP